MPVLSRNAFILSLLAVSGFSLLFLYIAFQDVSTHPYLPPLGTFGAAVSCFLIAAYLIRLYRSQVKPSGSTVRYSIFFTSLIWIVCLGVTMESWIGAHRWERQIGVATIVTTTKSLGRAGRTQRYTDDITYTYLTQGQMRVGRETLINSDRTVDKPLRGNERLVIEPIKQGEDLYIRVNPNNPEQSFIQRRIRYIPFILLILSTFILGKWIAQGKVYAENK